LGVHRLNELPRRSNWNLADTNVSDAGLAHLKSCAHLTWLDIRGTKATDPGVAALKSALPNLEYDDDASAPVSELPIVRGRAD
jgi:hypothetical protein